MPRRRLHETSPEATTETDEDLVSRTDKKRARRVREDALFELTRELTALSEKNLGRLGLPEPVLDAILDAQKIKSPRARGRQERVVRGALRDAEWPAVRARLDTLLLHGTAPTAAPAPGEGKEREWVVRLLGEGSTGLDAFLADHPSVDREHLFKLVRAAGRGAPDVRKRAEGKLARTIALLLRNPG